MNESNEDYSIHWIENVLKLIEERNVDTVNLSTGKTPSGHIHIGILREITICETLRRILTEKGKKVNFRLFFDSLDAAKRFPSYIPKDFKKYHLGKPFALIPAPFSNIEANNYAEYFGNELLGTFETLGINLEPIWSHNLYKTAEMKNQIRKGLKKSDKVKEIVLKFITASMDEEQKKKTEENYKNWIPAMVICEKCSRTQKKTKDGIKPNRVLQYDEEKDSVYYECPACGNSGWIGIDSGLVKLNWRLDWPAKWDLYKTTLEPAGKDHVTKGGSYDTGLELSRQIYGYEGPIPLGYEWIRLGDQDMSTSAGIQMSPKVYLSMVEPEIIRFLILKTNPDRHISFRIEDIGQYYEDFERFERIYYGLEQAENEAVEKEIKYIYPYIKPFGPSEKCPAQVSFKFLMIMAQLDKLISTDIIVEKANQMQASKGITTKVSKDYIEKRIAQTKNWLNFMKDMIKNEKDGKLRKKMQSKVSFFDIPEEVSERILNQLTDEQKAGLKSLYEWVKDENEVTEENLKETMIQIQKSLGISAKTLFQAIYLVILGTKKGPRLGPLLSYLEIEWLRKRLAIFE